MRLNLGIYALLMVVGLGLAYWASLPEEEGSEGEKAVFSVSPASVMSLTYETPKTYVQVARKGGEGRFWATVASKKKTGDGKAQKQEKETFPVNDRFQEILEGVNPLMAVRVIGTVDETKLGEYGLDKTESSLSIKAEGDGSYQVVLGDTSYGSSNRFAKSGGEVILLDGKRFESLERAKFRLYERDPLDFKFQETTKARIVAGDESQTLHHIDVKKGDGRRWGFSEDPDSAEASLGSWMDKISRLRIMTYAKPDQRKNLEKASSFLRVELIEEDDVMDELVFKRLTADGETTYWVSSNHLGTYGKVSTNRMKPIEGDLQNILRGETADDEDGGDDAKPKGTAAPGAKSGTDGAGLEASPSSKTPSTGKKSTPAKNPHKDL